MGCCGVFAVAYVAGKPIDEVFELFKKRYRKTSRWQGRTTSVIRHEMLNHLGVRCKSMEPGMVKTIKIPYPDGIKEAYAGTSSMTLAKWVDLNTAKGKTYIVDTTGHVQVVHDGIVHDQHGSKPVDVFWGRRKRVREATQIIHTP